MRELGKKTEITLLDYLLAIPVAIYFRCAAHLARSERCKLSPDGTHFYICKDMKTQCKWCGKIEARGRPRGPMEGRV